MDQNLTILHLEDQPLDTEIVQQVLGEEGMDCAIDRVLSLTEFRQALEKGNFQIILADYTFPGPIPSKPCKWPVKCSPRYHLYYRLAQSTKIKLMGGTVGVESGPGQGSRFWMQLQAA